MPETSAEFHKLELSCATIRSLLAGLHPHLIPDDDHTLRLKAYILLTHAAIEEYLEKVSLIVLDHSYQKFVECRVIAKPLWAACSFYPDPMKSNSLVFRSSQDFWTVCDELFRWSIQMHRAAITELHGIRTKHQDKIFYPLGLKLHDFDHLLSQALNSYGRGRGQLAHEFRITQQFPRAACEQSVEQILALLLPLDQELTRLCGEYLEF
jgi:hypothetical protein